MNGNTLALAVLAIAALALTARRSSSPPAIVIPPGEPMLTPFKIPSTDERDAP